MLSPEQVGEILSRHKRGEGKRKIARSMGISSKTVVRYLRMDPEQSRQAMCKQSLNRSSILDAHKDYITEKFWEVEGNCQNLCEELLREKNLQVNLRTLQWYCKHKLPVRREFRLAHSSKAQHPHRIETAPGEEVQIDFGEKDVLVDGKPQRIHFFTATLGYSRRIYSAFFPVENQEAWFTGLEQAFRYFGGIPRTVVCDNAKALVYKPREGKEQPIYNRNFRALCRYWGTVPVACRPVKPQHKGKVERTVEYIQNSFLKDFRMFRSIQDIQEKFELWERTQACKREMETADAIPIRFTPASRFRTEFPELIPFTKPPIATYRLEKRKVSASGVISVDNRLYKITEDLRNLTVDVQIGRSQIVVCFEGKTLQKLDKAADCCKPITRPILQECIVRDCAALKDLPMGKLIRMPPSILQRSLVIYEEVT